LSRLHSVTMSTIYSRKDSPYWWYEWKGVTRPFSLKVKSKKQALILKTSLDKKFARVRLGVPTEIRRITIGSLYSEYDVTVIRGKSPSYAKRLRYHLQHFTDEFKNTYVTDITFRELNSFKADCLNRWSNKTTRDCLLAIREMYKYAVAGGYAIDNPLISIDLPSKKATKPRIPPKLEHVHEAIRLADRDMDKIYWSIMLYTGLRTNDAGNLKPEHISKGLVQEKSKEIRKVILPSSMDKWGDLIYNVCPNRSAQARSRIRYKALMMEVGGYDTDFHSLGHLIATELGRRDVPLRDGEVVLGKKATINTYTHGLEDKVREIVNAMSKLGDKIT